MLLLGHRAGDDDRLAAFEAGPGQIEHVGRLHVGERPEHLLKLGQIHEAGEAAAGTQRCAVGGDFHGVDHLAEGGRPPVEMLDAAAFQPLGVEEALHRVHLDHRVADRRAGGEGHAVAGMPAVEIPGFHVKVEGAFAAAGLDARHAVHLGRRLQVLEEMRLVDEDMVNSKLVEHQPIVLLVLGEEVLEPFLAGCLLFFNGLDDVAVSARAVGAGGADEQLVVFRDLLAQELFLVVARHADALEASCG